MHLIASFFCLVGSSCEHPIASMSYSSQSQIHPEAAWGQGATPTVRADSEEAYLPGEGS